jgi:ABC-type uncharacterized transport system involved in gliding motility auxiliary subunit
MQVTATSRLMIRLQNILFMLLFLTIIGLLAWLSTRYVYQADWTTGARNTLAPASQTLLDTLAEPVSITAYARAESVELRQAISEFIDRYQRYKPDIELRFVNPDTEPQQVRELGITLNGELLINYAGRSEKLQDINEQALTNTLQRLSSNRPMLVFLSGHGEQDPHGKANFDLGTWSHTLKSKGMQIQSLKLGSTGQIPDNTGVLVIASPQVDYLPGEVKIIQNYLEQGGNLLWLCEPNGLHGLAPLAEQLGIRFPAGVVADADSQHLDTAQPDFVIISEYAAHPITHGLDSVTLFPHASAITLQTHAGWSSGAFLVTPPRTWLETGKLTEKLEFNPENDLAGPLNIGVSLMREITAGNSDIQEQRVVVAGDGDFLSNTYLGNGGNLDLGLHILNWLSYNDNFIAISARIAPDTRLDLSPTSALVIALGFLFFLPALLLSTGLAIWLRRRKR